MKRLFLASVVLLAGCAGTLDVPAQKTLRQSSVSYTVGIEQTSFAGEPMVVEEELLYYMASVAASDYQIPPQLGSAYPLISTGMEFVPYGTLKNGDTLLRSEGLKPRTSMGEPVPWEYCIAIDSSGEAYGDTACSLGITRRWAPRPENFLETKPVYKEGSSRKELIYGGMSGETIRVAYRESAGKRSAQALQQDLAYDLSQSRTIRFRDMEIEVREATSNQIRFIVRSGIKARDSKGGR